MKIRWIWLSLLSLMVLLPACSEPKANPTQANNEKKKQLIIQPLKLTEKEKLLIRKTNTRDIKFFELNGSKRQEEQLVVDVIAYHNGKESEFHHVTADIPSDFQGEILSFGISAEVEKQAPLLLTGVPGGLVTSPILTVPTSSMLVANITKPVKLHKNKPVYIAYWLGASKNHLSYTNHEGAFPEEVKEVESAYVYKITLVESKTK